MKPRPIPLLKILPGCPRRLPTCWILRPARKLISGIETQGRGAGGGGRGRGGEQHPTLCQILIQTLFSRVPLSMMDNSPHFPFWGFFGQEHLPFFSIFSLRVSAMTSVYPPSFYVLFIFLTGPQRAFSVLFSASSPGSSFLSSCCVTEKNLPFSYSLFLPASCVEA